MLLARNSLKLVILGLWKPYKLVFSFAIWKCLKRPGISHHEFFFSQSHHQSSVSSQSFLTNKIQLTFVNPNLLFIMKATTTILSLLASAAPAFSQINVSIFLF